MLKKLGIQKYKCAHLTYKLLPYSFGKCKTVFLQLYSSVISIIFPNHFHSIHHFETGYSGILPAYVTVSVQSDLILLELQKDLFRGWIAFQLIPVEWADRIVTYTESMVLSVHIEYQM